MDAGFWHQRWEENRIAFHESEANPKLVRHFGKLSLSEGSRLFVPLCGKTLDIAWLLAQDCRVAAAEFSSVAIVQLFAGLGVEPSMTRVGELERYSADGVDVFVGDVFALTGAMLGPVDAVYDRAALVALPEAMRHDYTAHLTAITDTAPQLLITYEYDQRLMDGPPFSVSNAEVHQQYGDSYDLTLLEHAEAQGGLKGTPARENVWLLAND